MAGERIFDGAFLRAELHGAGKAGLFVSFDHYRVDRRGFSPRAPVQLALDRGFASLVISSAANDWFLNPDLPALCGSLADLAQNYPVVRAIGFSMGGYGALLMSQALGLSFATLWAPQVSIRKRVAPFETRFQREARQINAVADQLRLYIKPDLEGVILFDPFAHPAERQHARAIQALAPRLAVCAMPFSGHPPTEVVMSGRCYTSVMEHTVAGTLTAPMMRHIHVTHRWSSERYLRRVLAALTARDAARFGMTGS